MMNIFEDIQNGHSACAECERLTKVVFPGFDIERIKIKNIIWNHFRGCNSQCIYCGDTKKFTKYYEPIEIVHKLDKEEMIADMVSISFGGGEPTLLNNLKVYIEFGLERQWSQILNKSGLLNKEYIKDSLLRDDKFSVQISVDSGTSETYFKIKG